MKRLLLMAPALLTAAEAAACTACFGQSNDQMAVGMNAGIYFMLGVLACVLATLGSFFFCLARRARAASVTTPDEI